MSHYRSTFNSRFFLNNNLQKKVYCRTFTGKMVLSRKRKENDPRTSVHRVSEATILISVSMRLPNGYFIFANYHRFSLAPSPGTNRNIIHSSAVSRIFQDGKITCKSCRFANRFMFGWRLHFVSELKNIFKLIFVFCHRSSIKFSDCLTTRRNRKP